MSDISPKTKYIEVVKIKKPSSLNIPKKPLKIALGSLLVGIIANLLFSLNHFVFIFGATFGGLITYLAIRYRFYKRAAKVIQKTGLIPFIGFGLYFLWVASWLVRVEVWSSGSNIIDEFLRPSEGASDFAISYAASALDSLVFFILVGFILAIIALKKPEEEKLNRKIEYIFPDVEPDSKLLPYLVESVSALACINTAAERVLTITEVSDCGKFVKISLKSHSVIKNIHNNTDYANEEMPWSFMVDAQVPNEELLGEIHELSIVDKIGDCSEEKHIIQGIVQLTDDNREYNTHFPMKLTAGQEVVYQANCWSWESIGNPFSFGINRYTQYQNISILNMTNEDLAVSVTHKDGQTNQETTNTYELPKLENSGKVKTVKSHQIENTDLCPYHSIVLNFISKR